MGAASSSLSVASEHGSDRERLASIVRSQGLVAEPEGDLLVVQLDAGDARGTAVAISRAAAETGIVLAELHTRRPTLESHYLSILEGDDR
jgi:hypothetical protein